LRYAICSIEIFDVFGKLMAIPRFARNEVNPNGAQRNEESRTINISHLPAGIYFIKMETKKGVITQKIIKY
jgi:hypothetical protein